MTLIELLREKVEANYLNGELFWRVRGLDLCIFGKEDDYHLMVGKSDSNPPQPVGIIVIAKNVSANDIDALIKKLEHEITHATHWISQDAIDGFFDEPANVKEFNDLKCERVDPFLYTSGCGHLARDFDQRIDQIENKLTRLMQHISDRKEDGLIGKGIPGESNGEPDAGAMAGYNYVIEQAVDRWIQKGGLVNVIVANPS